MLVIDKNSKKEALEMVDFLNEKIITDIEWTIFTEKNKLGIVSHNIRFKISTIHMGYGFDNYYFIIDGLNTWNKDILLENITNHYDGKIKGLNKYINIA
jgi:hypothetical protein